mgnify:CR=1 FL=1
MRARNLGPCLEVGGFMKRMDIVVKVTGDEIPAEFILSHLFTALHGLLVRQKDADGFVGVGVGFPEYDADRQTLGRVISLFGGEDSLSLLGLPASVPDIRDFVRMSGPVDVVSFQRYATFRKVKPKAAPENKIRRAMRRHGYSREEAERKYSSYYDSDRHDKVRGLPYLKIYSQSTGQIFPVYIKREVSSRQAGKFNTFGLQASSREIFRLGLNPGEFAGGVPV